MPDTFTPYPAPTQPRPAAGTQHRPAAVQPYTPYPSVTTALNVPTKFAPVPLVRLNAGDTHQLKPVLVNSANVVQVPKERFRYQSNNPKLLVSDTGLICTNIGPTPVSRRGAAERAIVTISYGATVPVITTLVNVLVATDFNDIVSD